MIHLKSHTCKLGSMVVLVLIYFIVELVVGNALHSITLVADSFHMLSDFIALIIGIAARRIGKWPKSNKNTFGWQRAEVVGTLVNTVMLTTLTFTIFIDTIQRFIKPEQIENPPLLLGVGAGGLLVNIIGLIILRGHHGHSHGNNTTIEIDINEEESNNIKEINDNEIEDKKILPVTDSNDNNNSGNSHLTDKHGHSHDNQNEHSHKKVEANGHRSGSMNLKAVFLHVLADFFGSVAVVVSALIIWLVPNVKGKGDSWKNYIDPSISLLMVVLILISTIPLLKKSALILLQSVPKEVSVKKLKERMETIDGIDKVHDLHVWELQSDVIIGTVHIRCANENYVTVSKKAKNLFHDFNIHCTTIQAEFKEHVEDSNSNQSVESGANNECILYCEDKSTVARNNECKGKQYCCPIKNVIGGDLTVTLGQPLLKHRLSAPCLTSMVSVTHSSNIPLENIVERH